MFNKDRSDTVFIFYIWRMNWKWYIPLLIVCLAFVSAGIERPITDPNQEIVISFYTHSINDDAAEDIISDITHTLESLGIEDVRISRTSKGDLKILYYSAIDVSVIKEVLVEKNQEAQGDFETSENDPLHLPNNKDYSNYNLEVAKIQQDFSQKLPFQGALAEIKSIPNQYFKISPSLSIITIDTGFEYDFKDPEVSVCSDVTVLIHRALYERIPEVRAGPIS